MDIKLLISPSDDVTFDDTDIFKSVNTSTSTASAASATTTTTRITTTRNTTTRNTTTTTTTTTTTATDEPSTERQLQKIEEISPTSWYFPNATTTFDTSLHFGTPQHPTSALLETPYPPHFPPSPHQTYSEPDDPEEYVDEPIFSRYVTRRYAWRQDEKEKLSHLRMVERAKWSDIAAALPGRSPASCRSQWHYQGHEEKEKRKEEREKEIEEQNRLVMEEMRKSNEKDKDRMAADWGNCEWSEYLKTEFAYTYERLRQQMWHKIALEMKLPWRSVEAWHWTIGRKELAKRVAGLHQHESPTDLDLGAAEEDSSLVFPDDDPDEDPELEPDIDYEFETKPGEASTCSAGATRVTGK